MKKTVYSLICLAFILPQPEHPAWADWTQDGGSLNFNMARNGRFPDITFCNNTPYVAWHEPSLTFTNQIIVKCYTGGSWIMVGSGSLNVNDNYPADYPRIAVGNNTPYVAWKEYNGAAYQIHVKHYADGTWVPDGGSLNVDSSMNATAPSITVFNSTPYVAWQELDGTSWHEQIYVKHYAGGVWVPDGDSLNLASNMNAVAPSITVFNGTPYVAWQESDGSTWCEQIYVKHYAGGVWVLDGDCLNVVPDANATSPSIAVFNGTPYVAWQEFASWIGCYQIYVKHYADGVWVLDGGTLNFQTSRHAYLPSLAITNNTPYVTWHENAAANHQVHVKHYAGDSWVPLNGILNVNASEDAQNPRIAISNGTVYVARQEDPTGIGINRILVAHYVPPTATLTITPTTSPTPTQTMTYTITPTRTVSPTITPTSIPSPTPTRYALEKYEVITYPSPARGKDLWFYYYVNGPAQIKIEVYNVLGELCHLLQDQSTHPGYCRTHWDIGRIAHGVYLYSLSLETSQGVRKYDLRKLVIVK
ncbi:hypothetical protein KAR10_01525 [bacterium]|nr:hypothetical protein [bacterium]